MTKSKKEKYDCILSFSYKKWLALCDSYGVTKYELIQYTDQPVYASKFFIGNYLCEVHTNQCKVCNTAFDYGMYKGNFFVRLRCNCNYDGGNCLNAKKLRPYLDDDIIPLVLDEYNTRKTVGFPNKVDHYIKKGYSPEDAQNMSARVQKDRSNKSPSTQKGAKGYSIRTPEYWQRKGYGLQEAHKKVSESQIGNGIAYYKKKYGEHEGTIRYNKRMRSWLNKMKELSKGRSPIAQSLFQEIDSTCQEVLVSGYSKSYNVDFCKGNKIIEFYGDYWHANPLFYSKDEYIRQKRVADIWEHDTKKLKDLEHNGFKIKVIWETNYKNNPAKVIEECKRFLNETNTNL
jgi:hypothetical protein